MSLKQTQILSRTPSSKHIEFSQRPSIVERLRQYASENLADVGGHLMVRVHEPSLTLNAWCRPREKTMCYLQLWIAHLTPWQAQDHDRGLHYSINQLDEVLELGSSLVTPQSSCDELMVMFERDQGLKPELFEETREDMRERSLRAIAGGLVSRRERKRAQATGALARLSSMSLKAPTEMTEEDHNDLLDAMIEFQPNMNSAERLLLRLAEERWNDRPLSLGGIVKPGKTLGA
ncbi:hypothetical protein O9X98_04595 [Agrobacterium salinitolerans]|nr:hypothetical protein [Agrobacterium salinitolerans]